MLVLPPTVEMHDADIVETIVQVIELRWWNSSKVIFVHDVTFITDCDILISVWSRLLVIEAKDMSYHVQNCREVYASWSQVNLLRLEGNWYSSNVGVATNEEEKAMLLKWSSAAVR